MYEITKYASPIGMITLASDGQNVIGLWLEGQKYHGETLFEEWVENDRLPVFELAKQWLDQYFAGETPAIADLPLAPIGSEFRQAVWKILEEIPYGQVVTYGQIAEKMALDMGRSTMSSQAVGGAVGHNPISIIIPCHRVVGSDGSLTGYAGGLPNKIKLLTLEGVDMTDLYVPKQGTAL
ncbi:MAG: methylated-DNA--[protein]-cysteine S-methyltransferase [Lactococcus raffinolactis]